MKTPPSSPAYRCPKCDAIGRLVDLQSAVDAVILSFQCPYCKHSWSVTKSDPLKNQSARDPATTRLVKEGESRLDRLARRAKELDAVTADAARTQQELAAEIRRIGQRDRVTKQPPLGSVSARKKSRKKKARR